MSELKLRQTKIDGRYNILKYLARGSYADIYVAHGELERAPRTPQQKDFAGGGIFLLAEIANQNVRVEAHARPVFTRRHARCSSPSGSAGRSRRPRLPCSRSAVRRG